MRIWSLFLTLYFCLCLLAGCGGGTPGGATSHPQADGTPTQTTDESPASGELSAPVDEAPWFVTLRIVSGADSGQLLLAENGEAATAIYTLDINSLSFVPDFDAPLRNGQLLNVYYDSFTEGWPMCFGGVSSLEAVEGGFDDRCALYLQVLEDLWAVDSALNEGIERVGVDLSQTSLSPAERAAVGWAFAANHGVEVAEGTLNSLIEQGDISAYPLTLSGSGTDLTEPKHYFYEWENGCHFSITEQPMEGVYSLVPVTFDARKWRSSLGAYYFSDCTALQNAMGEWSDYHIGAEMIS